MSFRWSAAGGIEALSTMAGVRFDRVFTDLDAIAEAYAEGMPIARDRFGPDVPFGRPRWAGISYGHVNCLGSPLVFPEDSEVAHTPIYDSLEQAVKALRREVDFAAAGMFPFYLELWEKLKDAFPEHNIPFAGFGAEGPVTTAWLLRGHDFFTDLYDAPAMAKEYLALVTASIVEYKKLLARINGQPEFSPVGAGIADDGAAMIPPRLWPEFVVPALEAYFASLTSGSRSIHVEDLVADHLPYLDGLRITHYDPSVSLRLTPALIRQHCRVPFTWRFNEIEGADFTPAETAQWVFDAAAQGAPGVATGVWRNNCTPNGAANIRTFMRAAERVKRLLADGCPPDRLLEHGPDG